MSGITWTCLVGAGLALVAAFSGWWRYALWPFRINPSRMTVRRLGLQVTDPAYVERVDAILEAFLGGFNAMLTGTTWSSWQRYCKSLSPLLRPFAEEGAAMGYVPRRMFRYDAADFEERIVRPRPGYRYLYYVGLGFWSGMRNHSAAKVMQIADGLDPLHRYLCFDGYGFKVAFFDYPKDPAALRRLDAFEGYARNAAYQGAGRALHFLYMGRPDLVIEEMSRLGANDADVAAGVGLAAAFINPDRLELEFKLGRSLPIHLQPHFHLGICFGMKARSINDLDEFERNLTLLPVEVREAVWASIRECDRVELLIRADGEPDGYRRWRERVTQWMTDHVEFPLQRVTERDARSREVQSSKFEVRR